MWPIVVFQEKIIWSMDFIYIDLFSWIIQIWYSIFEYSIGPD